MDYLYFHSILATEASRGQLMHFPDATADLKLAFVTQSIDISQHGDDIDDLN